jgi:hypothetical protein
MTRLDLIAFDADDMLGHSENLHLASEARFEEILAPYCPDRRARAELVQNERRNLRTYG